MENFISVFARAVRLTRVELAATSACAFSFIVWNAAARQVLTLDVVGFFAVFCLACLLAGRGFCAAALGPDDAGDFPTVFLFGFLIVNSALYLLAWISPLSIVANAVLILVGLLVLHGRRPLPVPDEETARRLAAPGLLVLALCLMAATFWSRDSITSVVYVREAVVVKPWIDSHYHACQVQVFRNGHGFATLNNFGLAGRPLRVYHYASYLVPALISAATATSAYLAYASFLVPAGVVLAGLAAYALVRSLWGSEAGIAAAATLLLLPDATLHGLPNPLLGYHWLQQIAPGGLYGVAFLTAAMVAHFKAHLFVAGAFLIWLYPGVFLRGVRWRWKAAWLVFALTAFIGLVSLTQRSESIPCLQLDGSSIKTYMNQTVARLYYARQREYFGRFTPTSSLVNDAWWGSILLSYASLGLFGVASIVLAVIILARRVLRAPARVAVGDAVFPVLIIVNYLVMSLGLAFDRNNPAHPDELHHRPFVWAYFIAAVWVGGLSYLLVLDGLVRRSPRLRNALIAGGLVLLVVPLRMGPRIQVGPMWGHQLTFQSYPRGWFECARYLRENASPGDVVQDSKNDPYFVLSAECGHPAYVIDLHNGKPDPTVQRRLEELKAFKAMTDADAIRQFAACRGIRWYVLRPDPRVKWPESLLAKAVFSWNGCRVLSFEPLPCPPSARRSR